MLQLLNMVTLNTGREEGGQEGPVLGPAVTRSSHSISTLTWGGGRTPAAVSAAPNSDPTDREDKGPGP